MPEEATIEATEPPKKHFSKSNQKQPKIHL